MRVGRSGAVGAAVGVVGDLRRGVLWRWRWWSLQLGRWRRRKEGVGVPTGIGMCMGMPVMRSAAIDRSTGMAIGGGLPIMRPATLPTTMGAMLGAMLGVMGTDSISTHTIGLTMDTVLRRTSRCTGVGIGLLRIRLIRRIRLIHPMAGRISPGLGSGGGSTDPGGRFWVFPSPVSVLGRGPCFSGSGPRTSGTAGLAVIGSGARGGRQAKFAGASFLPSFGVLEC